MTVLLEGKKVRIPTPKLLTYADYARLLRPIAATMSYTTEK